MRLRAVAVFALATWSPLNLFAQATAPAAPPIDFSGVLFGYFQYQTDSAAKASAGGKQPNKFFIERAYLTFRMPAGDRTNVRVTTDIFQNTATYYGGWVVRLKYGYVNRELSKNTFGVTGLTSVARIGMLHTVVVDHMEGYWPRSLGTVGTERNGFFSSSDVGAGTLFTLPNRRGEVYATIMNGGGYAAGETDRFKDFAARASFTPFANRTSLIKTLVITPWFSKGASASGFVLGGPGQVGPVSDGLQRDRGGLFVAMKERKLTAGIEFGQRSEELESGANTAGSPRTVRTRKSNLNSVFALVRPMEWMNKDKQANFGVVLRHDNFKLDDSSAPVNKFSVLGLFWDMSAKSTLTLDVQALDAQSLAGTTVVTVPSRTLFLHWKADF